MLFRQVEIAHAAISFGGAYLAVPNIGVLGSHGAIAVPLLATLLAWGRQGIGARIERCMDLAEHLAAFIKGDSHLVLYAEPQTGIVVWRPSNTETFDKVLRQLPAGAASITTIDGQRWFRNVAANPNANIDLLIAAIQKAM